MRVLIDTNILVSAFLSPNGNASNALRKCIVQDCVVLCSYVLEELKRVITRKYPNRAKDLNIFLKKFPFERVETPTLTNTDLTNTTISRSAIRDPADLPILITALNESIDVILTGDKDFLESGIKVPLIFSPNEYLNR